MIGSVIGNYRIEREIGEGGMSHVYVGRTIASTDVLPTDFPIVLKVMSEELAGEVTARKRFVKEAQILAKLRHRYITRFYEFINNEHNAVLVMEFVDGTPIDVLLSEKGAMPLREAISTAQCLLEAMVYAHGKGIIHRDIKPANLIREKTGDVVKVTDFGIGKIKDGAQGSGQTVLTKSGFLLGTPHYMSPEQIREPKDAGARADVYSAGVVLYEMLTGQLPFNSRSLPKLIDAIYRGEKPAPSSVRPEIDKDLEAIVIKAMQPRMENRFETAREFYEALEEYVARQPLRPTARAVAQNAVTPVIVQEPTALHAVSASRSNWALVGVKSETNESYPINGEVMVGRDRTCSIVLSHPAVSRKHAKITFSGRDCLLEDLKSANGTYVNNTRIERANLKPGDVVRFGADPSCSYVLRDH
jgi:eukaryotic-like serine/threonine-protein kinase